MKMFFFFHWIRPGQTVCLFFFCCLLRTAGAQEVTMDIRHPYLNIPIAGQADMKVLRLLSHGDMKREFPVQLAGDSIDYWIYIDVSEFLGQTVGIEGPVSPASLQRIYQSDSIAGSDSLYKEYNRPQFHFTVKRGWSNDINGPLFYQGQYHLFWQSFPFGLLWDTGFMYWGHAVSNDMLHWKELPVALMPDSLGSPWSGTAAIDHNNTGGFGKDALVLFYTAFDRHTKKQVQCIAYSTDNGNSFRRYSGNPVIDSNEEMKSNDTRDPKVFWYEPSRTWVMVLFEKDGLSVYNSDDMKHWKKQSHFRGLHECPDLFELPVDGDPHNSKWVIHGGSSDYYIGRFNGKKFAPESKKLHYAEGQAGDKTPIGGDVLYAAETFANMPGNRKVQIGWGRIWHPGMPFTQVMLFPTEFRLATTPEGIRLFATPIKEVENLHERAFDYMNLSLEKANSELGKMSAVPIHAVLKLNLDNKNGFRILFSGNELLDLAGLTLPAGETKIEMLIDKTVAEIFINDGSRYILKQLMEKKNEHGLEFEAVQNGPEISHLQVYEMKSIWKN